MKDYTIWIHHHETPIDVETREENMKQDGHTYIYTFIVELDA